MIRLKRIVKVIKSLTRIAYSKHSVHIRDNFTCQYCDKKLTQKLATIDHILPKSRGGGNTWENTVTACIPCNNKKDCRTPAEANMKLTRKPSMPKAVSLIKGDLKNKIDEMLKEVYATI
jgi:CRISPR/Cas system Type II protein with McrA/HNH and RuvC-like nuclease domain